MLRKENSIAYAYLSQPPEERKMVLVSEKELIVRLKSHDKVFPIDTIENVRPDKKILLFPTVVGGIICPLFLIGAFNNMGNIWVMMSVAFSGLLALYYGLAGNETFTIKTRVKEFDFFVDTLNPQLAQFCYFFNQVILKARLDHYFCLRLSNDEIEELERTGVLNVKESGKELLTIDELSDRDENIYVIYKPLEKGYKIGYQMISPDNFRPLVFSPVRLGDLKKLQGN